MKNWPTILSLSFLCFSLYISAIARGGAYTPLFCSLIGFNCPQPNFGGFVEPGYEQIEKSFKRNFFIGEEIQAQLAIYVKGVKVVDLWGDASGEGKYNQDSLQMILAASQPISSLVMAIAVDRGYFKYEDSIAKYWPEFAAHGKEAIKIEDLMRHEAGLPFFSKPFKADYRNFSFMAELIADSAPWKGEDYERSYHMITRDLISNELLRRTDPKKRSIGDFVLQEICRPLGCEFFVGYLPHHAENRWTPLVSPSFITTLVHNLGPFVLHDHFPNYIPDISESRKKVIMAKTSINPNSPYKKTMNVMESTSMPYLNSKLARLGELVTINSMTSASSLAKMAALIVNGGELHDVRLLSHETVRLASSEPIARHDEFLNETTTFTKGGWAIIGQEAPKSFRDYVGWGALGGSFVVWNERLNVAVAYTTTSIAPALLGDDRTEPIMDALNRILLPPQTELEEIEEEIEEEIDSE